MTDDCVLAKAKLLISETEKALANGTRHYDPKTGRELTTVREILECLSAHGRVAFEPRASASAR